MVVTMAVGIRDLKNRATQILRAVEEEGVRWW